MGLCLFHVADPLSVLFSTLLLPPGVWFPGRCLLLRHPTVGDLRAQEALRAGQIGRGIQDQGVQEGVATEVGKALAATLDQHHHLLLVHLPSGEAGDGSSKDNVDRACPFHAGECGQGEQLAKELPVSEILCEVDVIFTSCSRQQLM